MELNHMNTIKEKSRPANKLKVGNDTPQFHVRTDLIAGESVDACTKNLDYWRKQYYDKARKQLGK
jgi:hypothetical protein